MTNKTKVGECKCGRCPAKRLERGLAGFCVLPAPASRPEFRRWADAVAAAKAIGGRVVRLRAAGPSGYDSRFEVRS